MSEGEIKNKIDLQSLDISVRAPSVQELSQQVRQGKWFSGAEVGQESGFSVQVDPGTALGRLVKHFGLPNSPHFQFWSPEFLADRENSTWEYLLLVNGQHYFAVYDRGMRVAVGYRLASPRGASLFTRRDFKADDETCAKLCRYVEAVVNFPPEAIRTPWRRYP